MTYTEEEFDDIVSLAVRRVQTPEGVKKFGQPIGTIITADMIKKANAKSGTGGDKSSNSDGQDTSQGFEGIKSPQHQKNVEQKRAKKSSAGSKDDGLSPLPKGVNLKSSSISGPNSFKVGNSTFSAPSDAILIRSKNKKNVAYVVTADGTVHSFSESGEVDVPEYLLPILSKKFANLPKDDPNYQVEEFDKTKAKSLKDEKAGAILTIDGETAFVKKGDDLWENPSLGINLQDSDLQPLFDAGKFDLTSANVGEDGTDFSKMTKDEISATLDSFETSKKVTFDTGAGNSAVLVKKDNGNWINANTPDAGNGVSSDALADMVEGTDWLSDKEETEEENEEEPRSDGDGAGETRVPSVPRSGGGDSGGGVSDGSGDSTDESSEPLETHAGFEVPSETLEKVVELLDSSKKISGVKELRTSMPIGLTEAKAIIDSIEAQHSFHVDGKRVRTLKKFTENDRSASIQASGGSTPPVYQLENSTANAQLFRDRMLKSLDGNPYAASVYVYDLADYEEMDLFLADDGLSGIALHNGNEIVSVFSTPESKNKKVARHLISVAVENGGTRLDAFDTVLPKIYAAEGFQVKSRLKWNDEYAPEGWDKSTFANFNYGEPDVVFMEYDPANVDSVYVQGAGEYVDSYDDGLTSTSGASKQSTDESDSFHLNGKRIETFDKFSGNARTRAIQDAGGSTPTVYHIEKSMENAKIFREAMLNARVESSKIPTERELSELDLFMAEDGMSGIALREGDEIALIFSDPASVNKKVSRHLISIAVEKGGTRVQTDSPTMARIYAIEGFQTKARTAKFEFMKYDPSKLDSPYVPNQGVLVNDSDEGFYLTGDDVDVSAEEVNPENASSDEDTEESIPENALLITDLDGSVEGDEIYVNLDGQAVIRFTKTKEGDWNSPDSFATFTDEELQEDVDSNNVWATPKKITDSSSVPVAPSSDTSPGSSLTEEQFRNLKTGDVVVDSSGDRATKIGDNQWEMGDGEILEDADFSLPLGRGKITLESTASVTEESPEDESTSDEAQVSGLSTVDKRSAIKALEGHSGFQIKYGLKSLPDTHPLKDDTTLQAEVDSAKIKYPSLSPKQALIAHLRGDASSPSTKKTTSSETIQVGSTTAKNTQTGLTGGSFTKDEIREAIDILENFQGKVFKFELNKRGNPLGKLSPNDIVGFHKDKTVTKQKFIDLLKTKLDKNTNLTEDFPVTPSDRDITEDFPVDSTTSPDTAWSEGLEELVGSELVSALDSAGVDAQIHGGTTTLTKQSNGKWKSDATGRELTSRSVAVMPPYSVGPATSVGADEEITDDTEELDDIADATLFELNKNEPDQFWLKGPDGSLYQNATIKHIPSNKSRTLVYDTGLVAKYRKDVFKLDSNDQRAYLYLASELGITVSSADLKGRKEIFMTADGEAGGWVEGGVIGGLIAKDPKNYRALIPALVANGGTTLTANFSKASGGEDELTLTGFRRAARYLDSKGNFRAFYNLNPDYINDTNPQTNLPPIAADEGTAKHIAQNAYNAYLKQDFHMTPNAGKPGDGHVTGENGARLWGKFGASGVLMRHKDNSGVERFLLVQRAGNPKKALFHKWQLPGGAIDEHETDEQGATRETIEELAPPVGFMANVKKVGINTTTDSTGWHYSNITADTPEQFTPVMDPHEIAGAKWLTRAEIAQMESTGDLHPALSDSIRKTLSTYGGTEAGALPTVASVKKPSKRGSIKDPKARQIPGTQAGSNGGQQWDVPASDGTSERYFVKPVRNPEQGKQESLASELYTAAGALAPETSYDAQDKVFYSKIMDNVSDTNIPSNARDLAREDFVADAWLANWDVRVPDNVMYDTQKSRMVRLDNGGALEYRARGSKKKFGNTVDELDSLRQRGNIGADTFGARNPGQYEPWETISAQKVVNVSDKTIRDLVSKNGLNSSLADTLIARRDYIARTYNIQPMETPKVEAVVISAPEVPEVITPKTSSSATEVSRTKLDSAPANTAPTIGDIYQVTMDDATTKDISVSQAKDAQIGTRQHLSSLLYNELGVGAIHVSYDTPTNNLTADLVKVNPDNAAGDGRAKLRNQLIFDAWLGNWGAIRVNEFDANGDPIRTDLRATMGYTRQGVPMAYGDTVTDIDALRSNGFYGANSGKVEDFEWEGAEALSKLSEDKIRELADQAGIPPVLTDTLLARRQNILNRYGIISDSVIKNQPGLVNPKMYANIDAAESLAIARRDIGVRMPHYVYANKPSTDNYIDYLKKHGSVDQAFTVLWRDRNPGKPDRIQGQIITDKLLPTQDASITADQIVDLALSFEVDQSIIDDETKELDMPWAPSKAQVMFQVIARQRGWLDAKEGHIVSREDFDAKVKKGDLIPVFRGVNEYKTGSGKVYNKTEAAERHKEDGYWANGPGATAHGVGIYTSPELDTSMSYGYAGSIIEMGLDKDMNILKNSRQWHFSSGSPTGIMLSVVNKIDQRSDLSQVKKDYLKSALSDQGVAALILGYDAVRGNSGVDYVMLNKHKVTFNEGKSVARVDIPNVWTYSGTNHDLYAKTQLALQPELMQADSERAKELNGTAPMTPTAGRFVPNTSITASQFLNAQFGVGSIINITHNGVTITLKKTHRGWVNTSTGRVQKWIGNLTARSRNKIVVVAQY